MKKFFTFSVAVMATVAMANAEGIDLLKGGGQVVAVSASGEYAAGRNGAGVPAIWNVKTGDVVLYEDATSEYRMVNAVADNGVGVGADGDFAVIFRTDGTMDYLDSELDIYSTARGITADGTMVVGCRFDEGYNQTPGYWKDGEFHAIYMPDEDELGYSILAGASAVGVSADGSVILGYVVDGLSSYPAVIWTRNEVSGDYEFVNITDGYFEPGNGSNPYWMITPESISPDGRWIALDVTYNDSEEIRMSRMSLETGEVEVAINDDYYEVSSTGISNNGDVLGFSIDEGSAMLNREGLYWPAGADGYDTLGGYLGNEEIDELGMYSNTPCAISGDGKAVGGFFLSETGDFIAYMIDMELANIGVDGVATEKVSVVNGVYDVNGQRVADSVSDGLAKGIYVIMTDGEARKVMVK